MTTIELDDVDVPDLEQEKRQKRLAQLVVARQKAAEVKRRAAPKKELKKLEEEIKERLYLEDMQRVKNLRDLHYSNGIEAPPSNVVRNLVAQPDSTPTSAHTPFDRRCNHLDDLINILYS